MAPNALMGDELLPQYTVSVGSAPIHVRDWGRGSPVLLLHGNPDSSAMWDSVAEALATDFHCFAPDLPGFGSSEIPSDYNRSLDGMANFLEAFRAAAGIWIPLDLVAHDFGGPFALAWAVRNPAAVRRIVAINTIFFSDYRWHFWASIWRTPILGELSMALMSRVVFARELKRGFGQSPDRKHIEQSWALVSSRMKKEVLQLYRATNPSSFTGWEEKLLALTAEKPTMVIWGDRDPYIPSRYAERFGAAKVVHMPAVGHWPPIEAPGETAQLITRFLA
jgi:pimeloyl-ACP methyl ester carboxylesterase